MYRETDVHIITKNMKYSSQRNWTALTHFESPWPLLKSTTAFINVPLLSHRSRVGVRTSTSRTWPLPSPPNSFWSRRLPRLLWAGARARTLRPASTTTCCVQSPSSDLVSQSVCTTLTLRLIETHRHAHKHTEEIVFNEGIIPIFESSRYKQEIISRSSAGC